jgi:hypothetical protein
MKAKMNNARDRLMNEEKVASELLKVARELVGGTKIKRSPSGDYSRLEASRTASAYDVMGYVVPKMDFYRLERKVDDETWEMAREVYLVLAEKLKLTSAEEGALNRLRNSVDSNMQEDAHRNNIFKAANLLGIRLPSSSF